MNYKCIECNDTGSRDKLGTYLDCNACGTAATRRDLNDFVKSLGPTHPEDVALAIHQRALAMAPKQEAPAETLPEMTDDRIFEWAEGYVFTLKGMPHKMTFSRPRFVAAVRTIIAHLPAPVAAPAAANGTLTDERKLFEKWADENYCNRYAFPRGPGGESYQNQIVQAYWKAWQARAILAAAGPDAALIDAKPIVDITTAVMSQHGLIDHLSEGATQAFCDDLRAALSGAKGN